MLSYFCATFIEFIEFTFGSFLLYIFLTERACCNWQYMLACNLENTHTKKDTHPEVTPSLPCWSNTFDKLEDLAGARAMTAVMSPRCSLMLPIKCWPRTIGHGHYTPPPTAPVCPTLARGPVHTVPRNREVYVTGPDFRIYYYS